MPLSGKPASPLLRVSFIRFLTEPEPVMVNASLADALGQATADGRLYVVQRWSETRPSSITDAVEVVASAVVTLLCWQDTKVGEYTHSTSIVSDTLIVERYVHGTTFNEAHKRTFTKERVADGIMCWKRVS